MIAFISDDCDVIAERMQQDIEQDNLLFNHLKTEEEAAQQKNYSTNISHGVYLLRRRFARGFDIKFAKDAFVVVLALKNDVRASEIEQMIGRASRC